MELELRQHQDMPWGDRTQAEESIVELQDMAVGRRVGTGVGDRKVVGVSVGMAAAGGTFAQVGQDNLLVGDSLPVVDTLAVDTLVVDTLAVDNLPVVGSLLVDNPLVVGNPPVGS